MSRGRRTGGVVLVDGPCAGTFSVTRAPVYLRAVKARSDGHLDLLDQVADEPRPIEDVFVYRLDPEQPHFDPQAWAEQHRSFICPPPGATGTYRWMPDVAGNLLRDTAAWREWARAQPFERPTIDPTAAIEAAR